MSRGSTYSFSDPFAEVQVSPVSGTVLEQLNKEQDKGKLFGLFQALTYVASHELAGMSSISVGTSIMQHLLPLEKKE